MDSATVVRLGTGIGSSGRVGTGMGSPGDRTGSAVAMDYTPVVVPEAPTPIDYG